MQSYLSPENLDALTAGLSGLMGQSGHRTKDEQMVFASFNQDTTSLAVGSVNGYKLYSLTSSENLEPIYENDSEEVVIAERLFSSSLVALVSVCAPRKLRVCHFKKGTEICNYSYASKILSVKMNRSRLVVCLEGSLFVHNIRDMKVLHTIRDTPPNRSGLCALSIDSDHCYLAYPGNSVVGEIQLFDAMNLSSRGMISAHATPLAALSFNASGTRIASASEKGTVIRVFSSVDGARLYELRRGLKRTANIFSLSFSPCGHFLACSSNTETVHVFKLENRPSECHDNEVIGRSPPGSGASSGGSSSGADESWLGYLNTMMSSASASILPTQVTDTLLQGRAFATVHHNQPGMKNICALAVIKKVLRLLVASEDGYLYLYALNVEEGGDCNLMRQFKLMDEKAEDGERLKNAPNETAQSTHKPGDSSYADRVRNRPTSEMTDSEKFHEMEAATEVPPQQCFLLDDDCEFPPMMPALQS